MDSAKLKKNRDAIKNILSSVPKREGKLYLVDFDSREYEVEELPESERSFGKILSMAKNRTANIGQAHNLYSPPIKPSDRRVHLPTHNKDYLAAEPTLRVDYRDKLKNKIQDLDNVYNKYQGAIQWFLIICCMGLVILALIEDAKAREPQGEFSVLVEQSKTREDFKTKEEMLKFVKEEEKKFKEEKKVIKSR